MASEKILNLKKAKVEELSQKMKEAKSFVLADYRGLTVEQDTQLRREMREAGVEYTVIKNSIIRFAAKENGYDGLDEYLVGPTAMAISMEDPVAPSKLLSKFAKQYDKLEIKAGVVEGNILDINGIKSIASLPSREELMEGCWWFSRSIVWNRKCSECKYSWFGSGIECYCREKAS